MLKISRHIQEELRDSKVVLEKIENNKKSELLELVKTKYINSNAAGEWLWEKFIHYEAMNDDMAWSYIKSFVKNNQCIMFFNQSEDKEMFLVQSGDDLNYLLSQTYGFEFYITDVLCSYLLCFSHHNILYGCGTAEEWIKCIKR